MKWTLEIPFLASSNFHVSCHRRHYYVSYKDGKAAAVSARFTLIFCKRCYANFLLHCRNVRWAVMKIFSKAVSTLSTLQRRNGKFGQLFKSSQILRPETNSERASSSNLVNNFYFAKTLKQSIWAKILQWSGLWKLFRSFKDHGPRSKRLWKNKPCAEWTAIRCQRRK